MATTKRVAAAVAFVGIFFAMGCVVFAQNVQGGPVGNSQNVQGGSVGQPIQGGGSPGASVSGAGAQAQSVSLTNPLGSQTMAAVLQNVITFLQFIGAPIAIIMVLWGAFEMITSAGDPEKYTKGRETLIWAAIGFAIVLIAGGFASLISNILNGS